MSLPWAFITGLSRINHYSRMSFTSFLTPHNVQELNAVKIDKVKQKWTYQPDVMLWMLDKEFVFAQYTVESQYNESLGSDLLFGI